MSERNYELRYRKELILRVPREVRAENVEPTREDFLESVDECWELPRIWDICLPHLTLLGDNGE